MVGGCGFKRNIDIDKTAMLLFFKKRYWSQSYMCLHLVTSSCDSVSLAGSSSKVHSLLVTFNQQCMAHNISNIVTTDHHDDDDAFAGLGWCYHLN